jgi:hypothetical protein
MSVNSASETVWGFNLGRRSVLGTSATNIAFRILGLKLGGSFVALFKAISEGIACSYPLTFWILSFPPPCFQSNTTSKITTSARSVSFQTNPLRWRTIANFPPPASHFLMNTCLFPSVRVEEKVKIQTPHFQVGCKYTGILKHPSLPWLRFSTLTEVFYPDWGFLPWLRFSTLTEVFYPDWGFLSWMRFPTLTEVFPCYCSSTLTEVFYPDWGFLPWLRFSILNEVSYPDWGFSVLLFIYPDWGFLPWLRFFILNEVSYPDWGFSVLLFSYPDWGFSVLFPQL